MVSGLGEPLAQGQIYRRVGWGQNSHRQRVHTWLGSTIAAFNPGSIKASRHYARPLGLGLLDGVISDVRRPRSRADLARWARIIGGMLEDTITA